MHTKVIRIDPAAFGRMQPEMQPEMQPGIKPGQNVDSRPESEREKIIDAQLEEAAELIRRGELVAFPTETVYGLGADALDEEAAKKIYAAKGRPSDNPLIVHICDISQVDEIALAVPEPARRIMEHFWPGPLTVILKKKRIVPDGTTGGLPTVAIRMPSHPVARELIRRSGRLIAAPSANTSGRPSPTTAEHVFEDMNTKIPMIIDGGPVGIGIESTIIDMSGEIPVILRPGYISREELARVAGTVLIDPAVTGRQMQEGIVAKAPGMKYRHYAPGGQLILVEGSSRDVAAKIVEMADEKCQEGYRVGIICTRESAKLYEACGVKHIRSIGSRRDPDTIAASLYGILRECDECRLDYIFSECFFEEGLGDAVMNRLLKAAAYHLVKV